MKLCLFVGIDSENKTRILAQGFVSDEQVTSFEKTLVFVIKICKGHHEVSVISRLYVFFVDSVGPCGFFLLHFPSDCSFDAAGFTAVFFVNGLEWRTI